MELGTQTVAVSARVLDETTREPIWQRQKERYPGFAGHELRTARRIPVDVLEPR